MKVVVIGAGPAGLVTCKTLLEAATPEFPFEPIILEQESDIGGTFQFRSYEVVAIIHINRTTELTLETTQLT